MASDNKTLLTIRDLRIEALGEHGWNPIVHGVDLDLKRGEVLGLIGESGAGKSTIGLAAMGFARNGCRIAGGSINFDGTELRGKSETQLRKLRGKRVAYVAQSAAASFNPMHRLIDQYAEAPLTHGLMTKAQAQREAVALYERMRLPDAGAIGFRYPHQLSGGQLQRAMTAMAMACKPDLIIFDEPTTALDVTTQIEVLAAIRDAVRNFNTAAIYITHDLAVVAQMADRIKVLLKGCEVEETDTRTMLSAPRQDYTRSLWSVRDMEAVEKPPVTAGTTPLLKVDKVDAFYGAMHVLNNVSFTLHKGRTVALVGESGSGKSTTARVIAGLLQRSSGDVCLSGQTLAVSYKQRSRKQLQQVQTIYQSADTRRKLTMSNEFGERSQLMVASTIIMGDSAGGNLCAALSLRMKRLNGPMPRGQILIYPSLTGDHSLPSYSENAEAPLLRTQDILAYKPLYVGDDNLSSDQQSEVAPAKSANFSHLPPTWVITADVDPLRDDGPVYVAKLLNAGVFACCINEPQLVHGYLRARHMSKRAHDSFKRICMLLSTADQWAT